MRTIVKERRQGMRQTRTLFMVARLVVALVAVPLAAGAGGDHAKATSLVGILLTGPQEAGLVVVDVPLRVHALTVGAVAVPETTITANGKAAQLEDLVEGSKVRVEFRRVPEGDELISLEVLVAARPPPCVRRSELAHSDLDVDVPGARPFRGCGRVRRFMPLWPAYQGCGDGARPTQFAPKGGTQTEQDNVGGPGWTRPPLPT